MENNVNNKKSEIMSITEDFREFINIFKTTYKKSTIKILRKALRSHEKVVNDEREDDTECLQERIDYLNNLLKTFTEKNKHYDKNIKFHGTETIRYLFENHDDIIHFLIKFYYHLMNT